MEKFKTIHENEVFINLPKKEINLAEEEIKDLKLIRNYFGENDKHHLNI